MGLNHTRAAIAEAEKARSEVPVRRINVPSKADLFSICKTTDGTLFAVGEKGTILRSRDGGETWTAVESGSDAVLRRVRFLDKNVGWAIGDGGSYRKLSVAEGEKRYLHMLVMESCPSSIVVTEDGGETWRRREVPTNFCLTDLRWFTRECVVVCTGDVAGIKLGGLISLPLSHDGDLLLTRDGGKSWIILQRGAGACHALALDANGNGLTARQHIDTWVIEGKTLSELSKKERQDFLAKFPPERRPLIVGMSKEANCLRLVGLADPAARYDRPFWTKAQDRVGWTQIGDAGDLYGACAAADTLWAVGAEGYLVSFAWGKNGEVQRLQKHPTRISRDLRAIAFGDGGLGIAVGDSGACVLTRDGGATWKPLELGIRDSLRDATYVSGGFLCVGNRGTMLRVPAAAPGPGASQPMARVAKGDRRIYWVVWLMTTAYVAQYMRLSPLPTFAGPSHPGASTLGIA